MIKKITYIIYIFFYFINYIFNKITKKDFLILFKEFIENSSYTKIKILNKNIKFFKNRLAPSKISCSIPSTSIFT